MAYAGLPGGGRESLYSRPMREPEHMRTLPGAAVTDRSIAKRTMGVGARISTSTDLNVSRENFRSRPYHPIPGSITNCENC